MVNLGFYHQFSETFSLKDIEDIRTFRLERDSNCFVCSLAAYILVKMAQLGYKLLAGDSLGFKGQSDHNFLVFLGLRVYIWVGFSNTFF